VHFWLQGRAGWSPVRKAAEIIVSVGTTSLFPYIREPVLDAALFDWPTVEINPEETEISDVVTVRLPERAETCLEPIWQRYGGTLPQVRLKVCPSRPWRDWTP
jgi:hypothetical protein